VGQHQRYSWALRNIPNLNGPVEGCGDELLAVGTEAGLQNRLVLAQRLAQRYSGADVPEARRVIHGARDHHPPVGTELSMNDGAFVLQRLAHGEPIRRIP